MRFLITGAAGFIGSQVTRILVREGHDVYCVIRESSSKARLRDIINDFSVLPVDLRDETALRAAVSDVRPECAIHVAWCTVPGEYWTTPENLDCVVMSLSLARALAEAGCKRLVAAGTCAEYDWDYGFLSEEVTPTRPRTLYGVCKNAAHMILREYCLCKSIDFAWTRFFHLYGPGEPEKRLVPSVILALLKGHTARCTMGEQVRDFLHVEDAASAMCAVAKSSLTGPVNVGAGDPVKIRTIVETLAQITARTDGISLGALPSDPEEPPMLVADVRRLRTQVGWSPGFTLYSGLENTVAWWGKMISRDLA